MITVAAFNRYKPSDQQHRSTNKKWNTHLFVLLILQDTSVLIIALAVWILHHCGRTCCSRLSNRYSLAGRVSKLLESISTAIHKHAQWKRRLCRADNRLPLPKSRTTEKYNPPPDKTWKATASPRRTPWPLTQKIHQRHAPCNKTKKKTQNRYLYHLYDAVYSWRSNFLVAKTILFHCPICIY